MSAWQSSKMQTLKKRKLHYLHNQYTVKARIRKISGLPTIVLYIGKKVAKKLHLTAGEAIKFYYATDDPRLWTITKNPLQRRSGTPAPKLLSDRNNFLLCYAYCAIDLSDTRATDHTSQYYEYEINDQNQLLVDFNRVCTDPSKYVIAEGP